MRRICEPELMQEPIQARAYAEADFSGSDRAFTARILELLAAQPAARASGTLRILDLGCGPGNISFRLAEALPAATVLGLDGAAAMVQLAVARQALEPRRWPLLHFVQASLPLSPGSLDTLPALLRPPYQLIVSNSLLHHLHDPAVLWRTVLQLGAPGALLVLRDLRRPADEGDLRALVRRRAGRAPVVLRRDFTHSLRAAFRLHELREQLEANGLETLRARELDDRYLEAWGQLP